MEVPAAMLKARPLFQLRACMHRRSNTESWATPHGGTHLDGAALGVEELTKHVRDAAVVLKGVRRLRAVKLAA